MKRIVVCTLTFILASYAQAQGTMADDQASQIAVKEAQDTLTQPEKRIEIIRVNPQGKKIDDQVKELMGNNSEAMYRTAADFLPYILQMGQGDPTKMAEFLTKASRNPASFMESLPANLKQQVKDLSQQVKPLPEQRRP
jgi:hypothetical protein